MPRYCNLVRILRCSCATQSKALAKSRNLQWTLLCSSKQRLQSCTADNIKDTVERWVQKPNCHSNDQSFPGQQ